MDSQANIEFFEQSLEHFQKMFGLKFEVVAMMSQRAGLDLQCQVVSNATSLDGLVESIYQNKCQKKLCVVELVQPLMNGLTNIM